MQNLGRKVGLPAHFRNLYIYYLLFFFRIRISQKKKQLARKGFITGIMKFRVIEGKLFLVHGTFKAGFANLGFHHLT